MVNNLKSRFIAGFSSLSVVLATTPWITGDDKFIALVYHLAGGRLTFRLIFDQDVDPFTQNMLSYHADWLPMIPVTDLSAGGHNLEDLAGRIEDLRYSPDPAAAQYRAEVAAIREAFTQLVAAVKPDQVINAEKFAARYLPVVDLGIKKAVELRRQLLDECIVQERYWLSKEPRILPADAWKLLQVAAEKKKNVKRTLKPQAD